VNAPLWLAWARDVYRRQMVRFPFLADVLALVVFALGAAWRAAHLLKYHDPRKFVYSDMQMYVDLGKRISKPGYKLRPSDVTHPPGMTEVISYFFKADATLQKLVWFQLGVTMLVPLAVGALGWLAFDKKTGRWALVLASLYLPFVDYGGYFLAEIYLTLTATLTMVCYLGAVRLLSPPALAASPDKVEKHPYRERAGARKSFSIPPKARLPLALAIAVAGGIFFSCAMIMKMVAAPAILSFLGIHALFTRGASFRRKLLLVGALLLGAAPLSQWQAERCTRGNGGKFCPGSNKAGADFLMGHIGRVQGVVWKDPKARGTIGFGSPAAYQHGYRDKPEFAFAITDNDANRAAAWDWIREHPGQAFVLSLEHVWDSFGGSLPWPAVATGFWPGSQLFHYLFLLFLFFPSLVLMLDLARQKGMLGLLRSTELALMAPIFGVVVAVMMATGEARYRAPWDMVFIVLAVEFYRRLKIRWREPEPEPTSEEEPPVTATETATTAEGAT